MCVLSIFPITGLALLITSIIINIVVLRLKGVRVGARNHNKQPLVFIYYSVFFMLFIVWLTGLAEVTFKFSQSLLPRILTRMAVSSPVLGAVGAVLIVASLILMLLTLIHFGLSFRFGMNRNNSGKLITKGVFSYSRNPFFLSINLFFTGQAMVFPAVLFIAMALLAVVTIHFFILKEEMFLLDYYREEYSEYQNRVRRYF